jgi:hypothetical protein
MSLLERDDAAGEVKHREVVVGDALPADEQPAESVVPAVGPFDDPASRFAAHAPDHRRLAATTNVRGDASAANGFLAVGVVVALVQAQMTWAKGAEHAAKDDGVEHLGHQPLVVYVRPGDRDAQRNTTAVRENVPFHAEFPPVRRVRPRVAPPLGAFAMALSSEAKSHLMPRRFS